MSELDQGNEIATVISHFGNEVLISDQEGKRLRAKVKHNMPALVCGDRVEWQENSLHEAIVVGLVKRHGLLTRSTQHTSEKLIAANIDIAFIVVSHKPSFKTALLDRYIAACELAEIKVSIVFNKTDALTHEELDYFKLKLEPYHKMDYPLHYISVKEMTGIDLFSQTVRNQTGVLVGQSGVGKSSILRALFPQADPKIGKISDKTQKGKHTTTYSELYMLDPDSYLIDSPGIREFGLNINEPEALCSGFKEFKPFLDQCQFRNCKHTNEPKCAVKQAVNDGKIAAERWDSYKNILASISS